MSDVAILVRDFRKVYDTFVPFDNLNFEVKQGEIFGLLGPNRAGLASALEGLVGLRTPSAE